MVKTRGALLREKLSHNAEENKSEVLSRKVQSEILVPKNELKEIAQQIPKLEGSLNINLGVAESVASKKGSSRSSLSARRKQLELEAAEAKAEIEKNLIEKRLAAKLAALEGGSSRKSQACSIDSVAEASNKVEEWLNKSQQEPQQQRAATPPPALPAVPSTSDLQHLARAMEQMASATHSAHSKLLSRLSTPKDLPLFFGDPLEWLQYKNSYEETSKLCNYNDTENVARLFKSLRGEAKEAVSSLLVCSTKPSVIMEALELRFGRPELIMCKIAAQFKKLQPLSHNYHTELVSFAVKIKNYVAAAESIQQSDYLRSPELLNTIVSKCPSVLINKWVDYLYDHQDDGKAKLQIFAEFLHREATKVASAGISYIHSQTDHRMSKKNDERKTQVHSVLQSSDQSTKCKVCHNAAHPLSNCNKFKRALRKDKWRIVKINKLCHKCLLPGHSKESCPAAPCDVEECGMAHHRLLHWPAKKTASSCDDTSNDGVSATTNLSLSESANNKDLTVANTTVLCSSASVMLKIVRVNIHGPKGVINTYALLDDGATVSLVSADLADCINLVGQPEKIRIRGAWNSDIVCQSEIVNFKLSNSNNEVYEMRARKINELDLPIQCLSKVNIDAYEHLWNLKDYLCTSDVKPKLLIGQDNYQLLVSLKTIYRGKNEPCATLTPLGWCLHGIVPATTVMSPRHHRTHRSFCTEHAHTTIVDESQAIRPTRAAAPSLSAAPADTHPAQRETHTCAGAPTSATMLQWGTTAHKETTDNDECLHELVRRSFAFEAIGVNSKPRINKDELRAIDCIEKSAKLMNNQWEVCLPWKNESNSMPNNFQNAYKRYLGVERKMQSDLSYATRYKQRMNHLFENEYARKLTDKEISMPRKRIWYLPHFGVDNPNKSKLRFVFDAAATTEGRCLNDYLLQGPDLLQSLLGIMLRFREKPVAFVGDIRDMFLRVKISEEDQHSLRFLWRHNKECNIDTYVMTSLIFGAKCSPFIAQHIKNKNAMRFKDEMPEATQAILKSHYVDDYIESVDDEQTASKLIKEVSEIHRKGGFYIRNWICNRPEVLEYTPKETLSDKAIRMKTGCDDSPERTLGLLWFPLSDTFGFDLSLKRIPADILKSQRIPTKRELLRIVMSIFDVFGFLAPFTIKAKIALQNTWKSDIKWDEKIPEKENKIIQSWITELQKLQHLRIPRCHFHPVVHDKERDNKNLPCANADVPSQKETTTELHVFCDASPSAYAAVAYYREITKTNYVTISFIACKYRASPIHKYTTVPKLELQAAVIACRLAQTIMRENRFVIDKRYFWTDSLIVLHQIKNDTRNYKVFVANRLGEIDELSQSSEWDYVPTDMNIADKATKVNTYDLTNSCEWFQGPRFLYSSPEEWPKYKPEKGIAINEELLQVNTLCNIEDIDLPVPDPTKFSSCHRLLRCTSKVLLFIDKCRSAGKAENSTEIKQRAENLILRHSQVQSFPEDIHLLKNKKPLNSSSRLRTLTPYIDEFELLRVGGRIGAVSDVTPELKNPVILDGRHPTARLIVKYYHERAAHGNNEMVVNEIRQRYWLLHLRPTVRSVASRCLACRIRKAKPTNPRLGDLPEARLAHHQRAFTFCSVDLFGPMEVAIGRRREKRYGVLFTCLTVRAIHIELVPALSSHSFIMALRRMAARRGWPSRMFSDNGTNFRGAATEIKRSMQELNQSDVKEKLIGMGVDWQFICPGSPHMGGAWERLIRSVKTALRIVLKERAPREEVLMTLLAEIENLVNSRPLCHVSTEHEYPEALTPNHFLIGSSSNLPVPGIFTDCDVYSRKQWRIAQRLTDMFWKRWTCEILPTLLPRQKWYQEGHNLKPGDVVIILDHNLPRNTWLKGLIYKIYPGPDGRVRVADVKTKTGVLTRPVTRLAVLPTAGDDCP